MINKSIRYTHWSLCNVARPRSVTSGQRLTSRTKSESRNWTNRSRHQSSMLRQPATLKNFRLDNATTTFIHSLGDLTNKQLINYYELVTNNWWFGSVMVRELYLWSTDWEFRLLAVHYQFTTWMGLAHFSGVTPGQAGLQKWIVELE